MDRAAFSIAAPLLSRELHIDAAQLGLVFSSFFIGYALFALVGGWASDRQGARLVIGTALIAWSLFCGLTAAAVGFASLMLIRILFGMSEGPLPSAQNKFVSNWFPRGEQARALGFALAGAPLGGVIAAPLFGFIAADYGWRASFIVAGVIGLIVAGVWLLTMTDRPYNHPRLGAVERAELDARSLAAAPTSRPAPLMATIARPEVLATAFAFFGYAYLLFFFLSWFPTYLTDVQHLSIKSMGVVAAIPWVLGVIGNLAGGWILDTAYRRTGRTLQARKYILVICLLLAAVSVALAGAVHGLTSAVALMAVSVFFLYVTGPSYFAIIIDLVEAPRVGAASGFVHFCAACAGIVAPSITGFMVQSSGSFAGAFVLAGAVAAVGALGIVVVVRIPPIAPQTKTIDPPPQSLKPPMV
jgi:ACS family hexuronate transporter-like MFS transporter